MAIGYLTITYPNFVLGAIIDPEEVNQNNNDFVGKITEIIDTFNGLEASTVLSLTNSATALSTATTADGKADSALAISISADGHATTALLDATDALTKANIVYDMKPALDQALIDVANGMIAISNKVDKAYVDVLASNFVLGVLPLNSVTEDKMFKYSTFKTLPDVNGIFTDVQYKRANATLAFKSVLSGGVASLYTTRTETFYDVDGVTILTTKIYTLNYGTTGDVESEVLQ